MGFTPPSAATIAVAAGSAATVGSGCVIQPKMILAPSRWSTTGTRPMPVSSTIVGSCIGPASTNALPSTGWPANGSSLNGVKIRSRACPPLAAGYTNTVSEKFISRAIGCNSFSGTSRASVNTASWLPASGVSVNTSAMTYRKSIVRHCTRPMGLPASRAGFAGEILVLGEAGRSTAKPCDDRRRGPSRPPPNYSVRPRLVEAVRALDALLGAGDVLLLQLLEVGHARHDVVALRGMAGLRLLQPPLRLLLILGQLLQRIPRRVHPGVG